MIIKACKNIDKILSEMPDDKDAFVLGLSRFKLKKGNWYVDTDVDCGYVAVSDNLEELKKYMIDNDLTSYVEIDGNVVRKRYYYYYEIFRYYGDDKAYTECINSFYDELYHDGSYGYYKEEELNDTISWRIDYHGECFTLDDWRKMDIDEDTIIIFNSLTDEIIETIKIKDIEKRKDIIDEIIRNNFKIVEYEY